jgi:glycosyltransferase involved in cell wall biosynthesis
MKNCKIVMITMFRNESQVIKRMLDSCLPHVDYYVMQNNGSTDGTDEIAKQFLIDNKLSGEIYDVEEGWIGFGWNRDHLIQYCQKTDHGCDWILKMDCDEVLEVDDDFDWTLLDNKDIQSFHIPAVSGTSVYHRAWMYNAQLPWRFNHDTCHETVYCDIEGIGENFQRFDLPTSFRQVGYNEGQSWSNPIKFISDALILEEKMIREGTMLTDLYHFWYVGKSYFDARESSGFPLGDSQRKEYARRAIYYFQEHIKHTYNGGIDETAYISHLFCGNCHEELGDKKSAIAAYSLDENCAPGRNDHLWALAMLHERAGEYEEMLKYTSKMMQPERTNAFPQYCNFIDTSHYYDSPTGRVQDLHRYAQEQCSQAAKYVFGVSKPLDRNLFVVDNFYDYPDEVRNFALNQVEYKADLRWYKGLRSTECYRSDDIRRAFESIIGESINNWEQGFNGCFQITTAEDPQVYHYDQQKWAAMIYLTPDAPLESGTRTHVSKVTGLKHSNQDGIDLSFNSGFYDSTKFHTADSAANIYNRLVIMDARMIHSAGAYFGNSKETGRLTHLFFFD